MGNKCLVIQNRMIAIRGRKIEMRHHPCASQAMAARTLLRFAASAVRVRDVGRSGVNRRLAAGRPPAKATRASGEARLSAVSSIVGGKGAAMRWFTNLLLEFLERSVGVAYNRQASASSLKLPELTSKRSCAPRN